MVAVTVRDVPDKVRDELAARAARQGQSLQEYLRSLLITVAEKPNVEEVLARATAGRGGDVRSRAVGLRVFERDSSP